MPAIDLSILNQRQTPAFYADILANRPAAGFVGRIFVSTNTFAFFRDNGTGWDLIGGPGTGTVTGSGAANQIAFWSGASVITGENNLYWDSVLNHLGVNTTTPAHPVDISGDQSRILSLNQTNPTNDTEMVFKSGGTALWRLGNSYGGGTNRFVVNEASLNINRFSVLPSSGQTFVGDVVTSSGLFVVNSNSGDAHIVALGATAPSIRVRNAGTGASLQFGLGLATTTNNFIQGATGGEFCIFNDSLTAQPILFGIRDAGLGNTQEAARISPARNFLIGTTTDNGAKLQVSGTAYISGNTGLGITSPTQKLDIVGNLLIRNTLSNASFYFAQELDNSSTFYQYNNAALTNVISTNGKSYITGGNLLIGTTTDAGYKLYLNGTQANINGSLTVSSDGTNNRHAISTKANQDANTITLSSIMPNFSFNNAWISLVIQIIATDGSAGNQTSYIYNCSRDTTTNWSVLLVSQIGTIQTVTLTFGGTSAAPTITITGGPQFKTVKYEAISR
jgi:hypothetical protein